jgi:hypothetical protein
MGQETEKVGVLVVQHGGVGEIKISWIKSAGRKIKILCAVSRWRSVQKFLKNYRCGEYAWG